MSHQTHDDLVDRTLGNTLGVASVGLGLAELLAPRRLEQLLGLETDRQVGILRVLGLRELMHGVDLLTHEDPAPGVFARVAGDLLDGALLGIAATRTRKLGAFAAAALGISVIVGLDLYLASRVAKQRA